MPRRKDKRMIINYTYENDNNLYKIEVSTEQAEGIIEHMQNNPKIDSICVILSEREKKIEAIKEKRRIAEIIATLPEMVQNRLENYRLRIAHYRNVASGATMDAVALTAEASAYIQGLHDMGILTDRQRQAIYTYTVV